MPDKYNVVLRRVQDAMGRHLGLVNTDESGAELHLCAGVYFRQGFVEAEFFGVEFLEVFEADKARLAAVDEAQHFGLLGVVGWLGTAGVGGEDLIPGFDGD